MHQALTTPKTEPKTAKKQRARRKRQIILGVVGFFLLWLIVSILLSKREKPIPVTTEKAARKTILQIVSATGKVQPETEVKISPEVAGEIIDLPVAWLIPHFAWAALRLKPSFAMRATRKT
jgi:HlyD family secretion protein